MAEKAITVELGTRIKDDLRDIVQASHMHHQLLSYADVRVNISEGQGAVAENGMQKGAGRDYSLELSVRVIAGDGMHATGYYGVSLGPTDLDNFFEIVKKSIETAHGRALYNAAGKKKYKAAWGFLGGALWDTRLAAIPAVVDTVPAVYQTYPLDVPLEKMNKMVQGVSSEVKKQYGERVKINQIAASTWVERELFVSSEGACIDQTFCYTQGVVYVNAVHNGVPQSQHEFLGHQRGWEILENGINEEFICFPDFMTFANNLADESCVLTECPPCPTTAKPVTVVTDPHYNTLKVHEIVGHPSELDRALKMETAYAGRSWLFKSLTENMIGKKIGSPLVNAYSDPSLPGYGHYAYDHEGTPVKKVWHIVNGEFVGFMNSRQTSAILGDEPNGHYKANGGQVVPLIRMSVTVFDKGASDPIDIIRNTTDGYYLVGHRTPSIAESRENFRISSKKVYKIEKGKLTTLYRDGGMMSDTYDYFMNVDAVGNDFRLYPIPNCGKGQPMQSKKLGNGGPTMRSRAKVIGGAK